MSSGWFVGGVVTCIVIVCGVILSCVLMRAAWAQREKEALSSTDLRALEESAMILVEQIKTEADRGIAELDDRCEKLRKLISEADEKLESLRYLTALSVENSSDMIPCVDLSEPANASERLVDKTQIMELASNGMNSAEIARVLGLDCAEVNLVLSLCKTQLN